MVDYMYELDQYEKSKRTHELSPEHKTKSDSSYSFINSEDKKLAASDLD
jgi:hypothetical protein